jgi:hypothetical protein
MAATCTILGGDGGLVAQGDDVGLPVNGLHANRLGDRHRPCKTSRK